MGSDLIQSMGPDLGKELLAHFQAAHLKWIHGFVLVIVCMQCVKTCGCISWTNSRLLTQYFLEIMVECPHKFDCVERKLTMLAQPSKEANTPKPKTAQIVI